MSLWRQFCHSCKRFFVPVPICRAFAGNSDGKCAAVEGLGSIAEQAGEQLADEMGELKRELAQVGQALASREVCLLTLASWWHALGKQSSEYSEWDVVDVCAILLIRWHPCRYCAQEVALLAQSQAEQLTKAKEKVHDHPIPLPRRLLTFWRCLYATFARTHETGTLYTVCTYG